MKFLPLMLAAVISTKNIPFTRVKMCRDEIGRRVEGYWAATPHDYYQGKYPVPQANVAPWDGKKEFIKKLGTIENYALSHEKIFNIISYRGLSPSRLTGEYVGSQEFHDVRDNIAWPDGLRGHYFDTFNVLPSQEFYNYVMGFKV